MLKRIKKDRIIGIGVILVAMFFFYHTRSIEFSDNLVDPGPRLLPYLAEGLMVICGIGMIVESEIKKEEEKIYLSKEGWKRLGLAFGVIISYAVALTYLGFVWSTPVILFVLINMLTEGKKASLVKNIVISIAITAFLYFVFAKGFSVMLPKGKL